MVTAGICFVLFIICGALKPNLKAMAIDSTGNHRLAATIGFFLVAVAMLLLFNIFIVVAFYEIWKTLTPQNWAFSLAVLLGMVLTLPIYLSITKQSKRQQV